EAASVPRFFRECGTIAHAKAAKDAKEDWLLEIGERIAHVPHAWDLAPSNLPLPILGTRSAMGGKFRYRGGIQRGPEADDS
ncbi:MAG: hypothetical protein WCJ23_01990, partial [Verrucomicrobiota bacterium]